MAYRCETYIGFAIQAYALPVQGGYVSRAIIRHIEPGSENLDVQPPARTLATAEAAVTEAIGWSRDLVDKLTMRFAVRE